MNLDKLKKLWIPGIFVVVTLVGIFLLWPRSIKPPTMHESQVRPPVPRPTISLEEIDGMTVKNRFGTFVFEKRGQDWFMTEPLVGLANPGVFSRVFNRLTDPEFTIVVDRSEKSQSSQKVAGRQAVEVRLTRQGRPGWHFFLGKSSAYTLFREDGSRDVWQIKGALRQLFVRDSMGWMDPRLVQKPVEEVVAVTFLKPDGSVYRHFRREDDHAWKVSMEDSVPKEWSDALLKRSVSRLFALRAQRLLTDAKIPREKSTGGVELDFSDGNKLRLRLYPDSPENVHVVQETRRSDEDQWRKIPHVFEVFSHQASEILLLHPLDLENPLVFASEFSPVQVISGKCEGFSYVLERDSANIFKVKSSSGELVLSQASVEGFFRAIAPGRLRATKMVLADEVPKEYAPHGDSDYVELELLPENEQNRRVIRIVWGKMTPPDVANRHHHYVTVSDRPGIIFQVEEVRIMPLCRTKETWQLKSVDQELVPTRENTVQ